MGADVVGRVDVDRTDPEVALGVPERALHAREVLVRLWCQAESLEFYKPAFKPNWAARPAQRYSLWIQKSSYGSPRPEDFRFISESWHEKTGLKFRLDYVNFGAVFVVGIGWSVSDATLPEISVSAIEPCAMNL